MFLEARCDVSTKAFAAKVMSTGIDASERIRGHVVHAYTTLKQLFGGDGKLAA
jgi:hypothetical protein